MKVLLLTDDRVGPTMAGSALRAWEMARALRRSGHTVCLAAAAGSERPSPDGPAVVSRPPWRWAEAVVGPAWSLPPRAFVGSHRLIVDGATPLLAELSSLSDSPVVVRRRRTAGARLPLVEARADAVLAAGVAQLEWWRDRLTARPKVPVLPVPFGIPERPPVAERSEIPGVPRDWVVVLWWGGVWPWLDLETLLEARARLGEVPVSVVVPTAPRPGSAVISFTEQDLLELAERYRLTAPQVVPLRKWVPYQERHRLLHRATLLAVLHHPGPEARLSFRTRALDGLWAGVPVLLSEGGEMARLARAHGWGGVVPTRDAGATAAALEVLIREREQLRMRRALATDRQRWTWPAVIGPLLDFLAGSRCAARRSLPLAALESAAILSGVRRSEGD